MKKTAINNQLVEKLQMWAGVDEASIDGNHVDFVTSKSLSVERRIKALASKLGCDANVEKAINDLETYITDNPNARYSIGGNTMSADEWYMERLSVLHQALLKLDDELYRLSDISSPRY